MPVIAGNAIARSKNVVINAWPGLEATTINSSPEKDFAMKFIKVHNLDRNTDEMVNTDHVTRIRDVLSRDQDKCTISFSNGDSMTALGSAADILSSFGPQAE